jgi:membrane protein DedA with SNARE-associated domain
VVSTGELWAYAVCFVTLVAAGLGVPAPEELVIGGAGVLAGQRPPKETIIEVQDAYPRLSEVVGLLAVDPHAGFPVTLPWAALVCCGNPNKRAAEDAAALLAVNPHAGWPAAVPWAALVRVSVPVEQRTIPPSHDAFHVRWWVMLPVCIFGVVLSDLILYALGWRFGDKLLNYRWIARMLPRDRRKRTEENFHRYGVSILVFGRLVPGIRAPLFLTAGSMRLPLPRFLLADGLGAVVGNSFFFFLGFWLGDSFKTLAKEAERFRPILIVTVLGLLGVYLLWRFLRHPVSTGDPGEVPLIGPQVASHMDHSDPTVNRDKSDDKKDKFDDKKDKPDNKKKTEPEDP